MSRYDYYAVSYGNAGRRPSTTGYAYYSAMKAEKDGRPREVNDFITKLLDEVNGPTVSTTTTTTTRSLDPVRVYGHPAAKEESTRDGRDGKRVYYEAEYTYVGPRINYGDPFDRRGWSTSMSSHPKSETLRDYRDPKSRWETSSLPIYDALPYNPPSVESYSSKGYYGARPESPRDDHGWARSSTKATSPTDYGNYYGDYPLAKPYSSDRYGIVDNGKGGPTSPKYRDPYHTPSYEDNVGGRDPYRANKPSSLGPQSPKNYGGSDNNLGVRSSSPNYDPIFAARDPNNRSKSSSLVGPQSPKTYGVSDTQGVRSTTPNHDPVFAARDPNQGVRSSSPLKPRSFDQATTPQSPKPNNKVSENQWDRSSSPEYEHPPRNNLDRWGNSPLKTQSPAYDSREVNLESPNERSASLEYEHPPRNDILRRTPSNLKTTQTPSTPSHVYNNTPKNDGFPRGQTGRSVSPEYEHPPRNEILGRAPSNRWDKSDDPSLKVQIPRDPEPNVAVRDGVPAYGNNAYDPEPTGNRIYTKS